MKRAIYLLLFAPVLLASSWFATVQGPSYSLDEQAASFSDGVWISKTEVSNQDYKEFLLGLIEDGRAADVPRFAPDLTVWERDLAVNDPYTIHYFKHPAFHKYPVVGISQEAAMAYCEWLTERVGGKVMSKSKSKEDRQTYRFRLPTEAEWMSAAMSPGANSAYFPGGYTYPRDHKGRFLFNHKLGKGDYAGIVSKNANDYEGYMITAPVDAFYPDWLGCHNMAGNVAEMVAEAGVAKGGSWIHEANDCRIESKLEYTEPMAWLGFRFVIEKVAAEAVVE